MPARVELRMPDGSTPSGSGNGDSHVNPGEVKIVIISNDQPLNLPKLPDLPVPEDDD